MFENLKLNSEKKKSQEEIKILKQLEADREALLPAAWALQPACEAAARACDDCRRSHGPGTPPRRQEELEAERKRLEADRDNPIIAANKLIDDQKKAALAIPSRFQSEFASWGREAMQSSPYDSAFILYIQKAIGEIEAMGLQPLEKVIEAMERHCHKIENWSFAEKPKKPLPMFRLQDVLASA